MAHCDFSDEEWALIQPLLPNKPRGVPRACDRRVLNGVFFILRTGLQWRNLPERYGPYTTVYNRFNRWAKVGIWADIFETLVAKSPQSLALIDPAIIRAHQHAPAEDVEAYTICRPPAGLEYRDFARIPDLD